MTYVIRNHNTGEWWSLLSGSFCEHDITSQTRLCHSRFVADDEAMMIAQSYAGTRIAVYEVDDDYVKTGVGVCYRKTLITWNK